MNTGVARREVESVLASRFGRVFERREKQPAQMLPSGMAEIDRFCHGFPRGAITEIHGSASSGRTSLLLSTLAQAASQDETCALVDCTDNFDLSSARGAGVDFQRLLWVRCSGNLESAFKSIDLLLHGGGFGFIALTLSDVPSRAVRRIISSWWFRFRRAIENTPTVLMVITPVACVRSCAAMVLELNQEAVLWSHSLSLVSEIGNAALTKPVAQIQSHLTLVTPAAGPHARYSLAGHTHFLQQLSLRVKQERPDEWTGNQKLTFSSRRLDDVR